MATLPELEKAFIAADDAGNKEDAAAFATEIRRMRGAQPPAAAPVVAPPAEPSEKTDQFFDYKQPVGVRTPSYLPGPRGFAGVNGYEPPTISPTTLKEVGTEGGLATAGQVGGAYLAPFTLGASIPIGGALGGGIGNYINQKRRISEGTQKGIHLGELLASIGTNAIPGAPLEAAGGKALIREGAKQGLGGLVGKTVQTEVDEGRLPTAREALFATALPAAGGALAQKVQSANPEIQSAIADAAGKTSVKAKTLKEGQDLGLVVPPSAVNPTTVNKQLESLAGKAATGQQVSLKNQEATNAAVKSELGIPKDTDVTVPVLRAIRKEEAKPYQEIDALVADAEKKKSEIEKRFTASDPHELAIQKNDPATVAELSPLITQIGADNRALRQARADADKFFDAYRQSANPEALDKALENRKLAQELETKLEEGVVAAGKPELADRLRASRTRIAKTYSAEEALNLGDANFDASRLGRQLDRGAPLSGNLEKIAKFQQAFPASMREGGKVPTPGVSKLNIPLAALLGGGTYSSTHNLPLAIASTAVPALASEGSRSLILSRPFQSRFAQLPKPLIDADPDKLAAAIRLFSQSAGQK